jgi:hypothetical protein
MRNTKYRAHLAKWQRAGRHDLRLRWGVLANTNQDAGMDWWDAERTAMDTLLEELEREAIQDED